MDVRRNVGFGLGFCVRASRETYGAAYPIRGAFPEGHARAFCSVAHQHLMRDSREAWIAPAYQQPPARYPTLFIKIPIQ